MGATGTGKSRLSIDLATRFPSEIINSDKIQVYKGLDVVTNKVPISERLGVPHHLLGQVKQDFDYTSVDFFLDTIAIIETILKSNRVPIIVGGSNSFLEALVENSVNNFKFLDSYVSKRVDQMVEAAIYILRLRDEIGWDIHRFDTTSVLEETGEKANSTWNKVVLKPCMELVTQVLTKRKKDIA
ncbi:hypothetical protein M9H77_27889 [Catharanthus roseus]|uniref:Uncharacterized protein n=1 Tax=Catharanthus roseus TaxID=4058 RepID=A0ACC0AEF2_CATRO|nr:hypothetical protein M9H77_27889 [Catharanthus roseus]